MMLKLLLLRLLKLHLLCFTISLASAQLYSIDFSQPVTQLQMNNVKADGYSDVAIRAYAPTGNFDKTVCSSVKLALNAELTTMIYMTPVPTKKDGNDHVDELFKGLSGCGLTYHHWWLQVVRPDHWSKNVTENVKFIKDVKSRAKKYKQTIGIYTSASEWKSIVGDFVMNDPDKLEPFSPLWYWDTNQNTDFNDFVPFGGWIGPLMKQFAQSEIIRGITANENIYAGNFR